MQTYTQRIIHTLEKVTASGVGQSQIFDDFLEIARDCLTRLPEQESPEMLRLRSRYQNNPYYLELFAQAFALLMKSAQDDWNDTIGEVYMEFGHPIKDGGQYFTPFPLALLTTQLAVELSHPQPIPSLVHQRIKDACKDDPLAAPILLAAYGLKGKEAEAWYFGKLLPAIAQKVKPVQVYDSSCGSGVMFLAAASQIPRWMLDWNLVRFYGQDIDQTCVWMAQINLMLHGLNGYAIQRAAAMTDIEAPIDVTSELFSLPTAEALHES